MSIVGREPSMRSAAQRFTVSLAIAGALVGMVPLASCLGPSTLKRRSLEVEERRRFFAAQDARIGLFLQLRASFNSLLAGRFPFSRSTDAIDANPADVKRFFVEYGDSLASLKAGLDADGRPAAAAAAAVGQLIAVRGALGSMLGTPDPSPLVYHVDVDFFPNEAGAIGQNEVIEGSIGTSLSRATSTPGGVAGFDWKSGQPISAALRWAANAPTIPMVMQPSPAGRCIPPPGGAIARFVQPAGYWALLRFVREQKADDLDAGPPSLSSGTPVRFVVKLCENRQRVSGGDPVTYRAFVFARLKFSTMLPDREAATLLPHFPVYLPGFE